MEHRDHDARGPDADRVEGSAKQMGGSLKEGLGSLLGDEKLKGEGKADKAEGKLQNSWGGVKDTVRDALDGPDRDRT